MGGVKRSPGGGLGRPEKAATFQAGICSMAGLVGRGSKIPSQVPNRKTRPGSEGAGEVPDRSNKESSYKRKKQTLTTLHRPVLVRSVESVHPHKQQGWFGGCMCEPPSPSHLWLLEEGGFQPRDPERSSTNRWFVRARSTPLTRASSCCCFPLGHRKARTRTRPQVR